MKFLLKNTNISWRVKNQHTQYICSRYDWHKMLLLSLSKLIFPCYQNFKYILLVFILYYNLTDSGNINVNNVITELLSMIFYFHMELLQRNFLSIDVLRKVVLILENNLLCGSVIRLKIIDYFICRDSLFEHKKFLDKF